MKKDPENFPIFKMIFLGKNYKIKIFFKIWLLEISRYDLSRKKRKEYYFFKKVGDLSS